MDGTTIKILLLVAMFILTFVFALLPIKVYKVLADPRRASLIPKSSYRSWLPSLVISLLTCFAGGVFIGVVFLDLLPDAEEAFERVKKSNVWNVEYPVVQLIALLGFFLVYAVEEATTRLFHGDGHVHAHDQTLVTAHQRIFAVDGRESRTGSNGSTDCEIHGRHSPAPPLEQTETSTRVVQSVVFTLALVIHCAFEGFAFGVQQDEFSVLSLFFGIMVHKSVVSFSVGLRLIRCHPQRLGLVIALVMVFVFTSPLFGAFGMAIEESDMDQLTKDKVSTVLTSASLGTFLYIAFFEMLAPERDNKHSPLAKMLATFVGFAVIAGVMTVGG
ncbi:hypothetical protein QR680_011694 [Steinernema hermaphroditum]|uniref:Uncharacterized protein n=1 Tax=Steinernema hermaphroditum TaxID=289476 RepID=A0AA39I1P8_9BILA|nr:hypothetical protein QR680_011694 [Steinernema hermaphroditum]